jgi:hypothetical protein
MANAHYERSLQMQFTNLLAKNKFYWRFSPFYWRKSDFIGDGITYSKERIILRLNLKEARRIKPGFITGYF